MARRRLRQSLFQAIDARLALAVDTTTPFSERLVHFWASHFAVSTDKFASAPLAGAFEAEAIRPHISGKFSDMLHAVESHPAMLLYLDQAQSVGPNSRAGKRITQRGRRKAGINENLAREILELHTLGVRSGYTQSDVSEFARALTGWTVAGFRDQRILPGTGFGFFAPAHEPGTRQVLGKTYREVGEQQGRAILDDLAMHPATAKFIATKLARHFVADDPPPTLISKLEARFMATGGDLTQVYHALIDAPEAWVPERRKFLSPLEWLVASLRTMQVSELEQNLRPLLRNLGQELWQPGSPAGFDDRASRWAAPDSLYRRVEAAHRLAAFGRGEDARVRAPEIYGELLTDNTSTAIRRAESPRQAMALLLASPEAMWR